jgi:hypothetical protein
MINLKDKKVLVLDVGGMCIEHAIRLGKDFGKVYYHSIWQGAFPSFQNYAVGLGMENIERIFKPFRYIDEVDLIFFGDIGLGDQASFLRREGHRVFGAGAGEVLEEERYKFRQLQKKLGLPTQKTKNLTGITNLRNHLKTVKDRYVKLDVFRSDMESFHHKDIESSEFLLDDLQSAFGPFKEEYDFVVEEPIKSDVEIGIDGFFSENWLYPTLYGFEMGEPYIGMYSTELPEQ